jgi:hypothetical protein
VGTLRLLIAGFGALTTAERPSASVVLVRWQGGVPIVQADDITPQYSLAHRVQAVVASEEGKIVGAPLMVAVGAGISRRCSIIT